MKKLKKNYNLVILKMYPFHSKNAYQLKEKIKQMGGKWDDNKKVWMLPSDSCLDILDRESDKIDLYIKNTWVEACAKANVQYPRKGTQDYENVKAIFKEMI
jgi:hypothetical protein